LDIQLIFSVLGKAIYWRIFLAHFECRSEGLETNSRRLIVDSYVCEEEKKGTTGINNVDKCSGA
jgi:hypothetical protein